MRKQVKSAIVTVTDGTGGAVHYQRGDVIDLPDNHPAWAGFLRDGHVVDVGELPVPGPEQAPRLRDDADQVLGAPIPGPIAGRPIGTGDPDADARAQALLTATLSARGLPVTDDVEDIDDPHTDTGLDTALRTVNPNPAHAPVVSPPAVPAAAPPAADPFAGVESGQQTATQPAAAPTAAPLDKPIRAASKATWVAYVASLPADQRDGLDEAGIDAMSKIDIVNTWGK